MRFYILVIFLKLLLNLIWNKNDFFIKTCGVVAALDTDSVLNNEYLQSELGKLTPNLKENNNFQSELELTPYLKDKNVENEKIFRQPDNGDTETTKVQLANGGKLVGNTGVWNIEKQSSVPKQPLNSHYIGNPKVSTSSDSFVATMPLKEVSAATEIEENLDVLQHDSTKTLISSETTVPPTVEAKPHNLGNADINEEESLLVSAEVLAQDFEGFQTPNAEKLDSKFESHSEIRPSNSETANLNPKEALLAAAEILAEDLKGFQNANGEKIYSKHKSHSGTRSYNLENSDLKAEESLLVDTEAISQDFKVFQTSNVKKMDSKANNYSEIRPYYSTSLNEEVLAPNVEGFQIPNAAKMDSKLENHSEMRPHNLENTNLNEEGSLKVAAEVIAQDSEGFQNPNAEKMDSKIKQHSEIIPDNSETTDLSVEESFIVAAEVLPQDLEDFQKPNAEKMVSKIEKHAEIRSDNSETTDLKAEHLEDFQKPNSEKNDSNIKIDSEVRPHNLENTDLSAEESLLVAAEVLAQDFEGFQNPHAENMEAKNKRHSDMHLDSAPNTIEPLPLLETLDMQELQHLQAYHRRFKDSFVLQYIEQELPLQWNDAGVQEWIQFRHNDQELLLGKRSTNLLLLDPDDIPHIPAVIIDIGCPITALETYNFWNFELYQEEGIIIVASEDKVLWYRNKPNIWKFELFGQWNLGGHITQISHFRKGNVDHLIVGFNHSMMQIFKFQLERQEYWMTQELYFEQSFKEFVIAYAERDIVLAVSQQDFVAIYIVKPDHEKDFHIQQTLAAPGVTSLTTFSIGGKLYLAISGYEATIWIFNQGEFHAITALDSNFGKIEYFLPIPLKTYQDDLVLMVHSTFKNQSLVHNLVWNGMSLESGLPIPCHRNSQITMGLSCILSQSATSDNTNLQGSSLYATADKIFLIIPGSNDKSKIFRFHFELLPENSELLDLLENFVILNSWFEKQHQVIAQVEEFLQMPEEALIQKALEEDTALLDYVETPEFQFSGDVSEIYLNDHLWSEEDSEINLDSLINLIEDLDKSLTSTRHRRELSLPRKMEYDELTYDTVTVEEMEIENLNGVPFFIQNGILEYPGEIQFQDLEVLGNVQEDVQKRQTEEDFVFEGDLEFDIINGIKWSDFMKNIMLRNQPQEMEALKVDGDIIVEDVLAVQSLNTLNFPDDYLLANGPRSSIVRAEKYFVNSLTANSVDTEGLINGQNPLEAITLMDHQEWQGFPVFNHLEVSEKLELHGSAHGRNVDSSPHNPTLKESKIIEASCIFNDLQVNGPIVLKGNLDEEPLANLLSNIVQRPDDPSQACEVNSPKTFEEVMFPIDFELENNTINNIPTENFVTVHTSQTLSVETLNGYVYFYNLTLKGLYDGIQLKDVLNDVIPLDKPLDLGTTHLIFEDLPLQADTFIVLDNLNGLAIKDSLQTLHEDLSLNSAEFEELQGKVAEFSRDILGPGKLNNIELEAFVNDRSWHEPPIQGNLFIQELIAPQGIQTDELHGIDTEYLLEFLQKIEELPEMVLNGQIQVDHITVMGDVQLHKVNGLMFDEDIQMTAIWLNRPNHLATNLTFQNLLEIKGNLKIGGNYQGRNLQALLNDFVIKDSNSSTVHITAPKSFLNQVEIIQNTKLEAINGKQFENLALRTRENVFRGSLKIKGNLITPDLEAAGAVTGLNIKKLENLLYYDQELYNFVLKGSIQFEQIINLDDLTVMGAYSDFPNLPEFFDSLIDKNGACELNGNYTFNGRVTIEQGLNLHELNGHDLEKLFKQLVFIQGPDSVIIKSHVKFQDAVKSNKISVYKSLKTNTLKGCSLEEWLNNTLRVDQDQYIPHFLPFASGSLDANALRIHFLNDIDLKKVITLNTPQIFEDSIQFSEVLLRGTIQGNGSVNGLDLAEEYNNTLMIYGGQHISTPVTIQSIEVLKDLQIRCHVNNNKDLNDVATLQENLNIQSPIYFQSLYSPQFIVKDLVTGIDFDKWFATSLRVQGKPNQYVTGNWSTRLLNVKTGPNDFQYAINGFQPWEYNSFIRNVRSFEREQHKSCEILKDIWRKLKQKSIRIKYIEEDFGIQPILISSSAKRRKLFSLRSGKDVMLLLNLDCLSYLFKWNSAETRFVPVNTYESGYVDQIAVLPSKNSKPLQFVTNYESTDPMNCSVKGLNLWSSRDNITSHERTFLENVTDLYRPTINESLLLILCRDNVKELNLSSYEIREKWEIPSNSNQDIASFYRFLVKEDFEDIGITNGRETVYLMDQKKGKSKKAVDYKPFSSPLQPFPSAVVIQETSPISWLKPNSTMARKFIFSDFKQTLHRMILDVIEKLNHQINITQLTIPESDLYDEHLIPDFLTAMDQLKQQKIYAKNELDLNLDNITIPENPAHVLATRVILVVWPKVEELQEIHGFLKDNQTHNHPLCKNITNTLGSLIKRVLQEAYPAKPNDFNVDLFNVVKVIRICQLDLQRIVKSLQNDKDKFDNPTHSHGELLTASSNDKLRFIPNNLETLRDIPKPEMLSLQVGPVNSSHRLLAISSLYSSFTPAFDSTIHLYAEDLKGNPFQIIAAQKPHSMIQFRLGAETLFGFIENCCQVHVWRYQGIQGFVKFANFRSESPIDQLLTLSAPQPEGGLKHYLVLLLRDKVKFYDIVWDGISYDPPNLPCP